MSLLDASIFSHVTLINLEDCNWYCQLQHSVNNSERAKPLGDQAYMMNFISAMSACLDLCLQQTNKEKGLILSL